MNLLFVANGSPGAPRRAINWHIVKMVFWATLVTGVLGLGLKFLIERVILEGMLGHTDAEVEDLFDKLPLIAACLFSVGVVIIAAGLLERRASHDRLTLADSIWIGLIQGLCLPFRGFSRSGATISMGLFRGVSRRLSEEFSFILVVVLTPPVIARGVWRLLRDRESLSAGQLLDLLGPGLIGMGFSFLAGLAALKLLSAVLEGGRWRYFGYYCLFAAGVIWLTTAMKWLP
jgi:undecaprenyl-diphosphatase